MSERGATGAGTDEATELGELRAWLEASWDPDLEVGEWWDRLGTEGWAAPTWPAEWCGRGLDREAGLQVHKILAEAGALGPPAGLGLMLAGPTIVAHGSDEQKARLLPDIVTGRKAWCQLFSEPGAGSDLAGLQTKAVRDGDEWIVNGQKVWTSGATMADRGMLLARTNPDVPKHKGITWFAFDMDQPGVDIRPLREMTGRALFNEVFLTDARVAQDDVIGGVGEGWGAALTTLANERVGLGAGGSGGAGSALPGTRAGHLERRAGDLVKPRAGAAGAAQRGRNARFLIDVARDRGVLDDALIRQDLMRLHTLNEIARYTTLRMKAAKAAGRRPGPEANTAKLTMSLITRLSRDLGLRIAGAHGTLQGQDAPLSGVLSEMALFSPAVSIYGGTDEIQRNIIGERVLGLPSEPRVDKELPFKDLLQA